MLYFVEESDKSTTITKKSVKAQKRRALLSILLIKKFDIS